ncbi:MAG: DUF6455 family protein [Acidobacteriota bacterium]
MAADPQSNTHRRTCAETADAATPPVRTLGDERAHYWLALEMSQTVGLDLQAEMDAGRLSEAQWAQAVQRCRGCDWAGGCPAWMAQQRLAAEMEAADQPAPSPPEACANAELFGALQEGPPIDGDDPA